jgi:hypothetical protein
MWRIERQTEAERDRRRLEERLERATRRLEGK